MSDPRFVSAELLPPQHPVVRLTLPYDVACSLASIVCKIGGDPDGTYRRHTNAILDALRAVNVPGDGVSVQGRFRGELWAEDAK